MRGNFKLDGLLYSPPESPSQIAIFYKMLFFLFGEGEE
jgi:hypothetical protein